jgi:glycosyltransferase involved in cell wall biosynthesis
MSFPLFFDAVLMLTWSDWKTEPRSNRYHYATRFAQTLPVLFLQHHYAERGHAVIEASGIANIDLINVSAGMSDSDVLEILELLYARGIKRPLLWVYDPVHYQALIDALALGYLVYHATEDYFTESDIPNRIRVREATTRLLEKVNYVIACSEGVARSITSKGAYRGPLLLVENGCDAEFFWAQLNDQEWPASNASRTVIFQGGINSRLDFPLLRSLAQSMPDWHFNFCGRAVEIDGWRRLKTQPNVSYLGELTPEELAHRMAEATVGIIPFVQNDWIRNSLPLKAFEYIACGIPVVSVPIPALRGQDDLIAFASDAKEFEVQIRQLADLKSNAGAVTRMRDVALANSYDTRFREMTSALCRARSSAENAKKRLRIAVLYDTGSSHVGTIKEHLQAFESYSRNEIFYVPATRNFWNGERESGPLDLSVFDVVIVHYSVRISIREHFDKRVVSALEVFCGYKVLFVQDEYEGTEIARNWMDRFQFNLVYTCVPLASREYVYPSYRYPGTEFLPTLTGYVPEDVDIDNFARPLHERKILIAYRGRRLPAFYGELGWEKFRIGTEMKRIACSKGLTVDIEVDDSTRIYGTAWYEFLGSARATLGTESGANVFDFDGALKAEIERLTCAHPAISFEEIAATVLAPHEGVVKMNQISPKLFEAIRLRTALVLFKGEYSGVVQAGLHYIELRKDFSNVDEVLEKLGDDAFLTELTNRAYDDVVASGTYSYQSFVDGIDADLGRRVLRPKSRALFNCLMVMDDNGVIRQALPPLPSGVVGLGAGTNSRSLQYRSVHWLWRKLPGNLRARLIHLSKNLVKQFRRSRSYQALRSVWRLLPLPIRLRILAIMPQRSR